jgi:peptidoglycan L-alanyl-D-glutamate endopeptidase CwlK
MNKLDTLEPDFQPLIADLITRVNKATGRDWRISDGRRTMAQQRDIYAQGRTKPGKVVSNAKPGQSAHNFGYAVDLWPLDGNGDFDWNASGALFKQMADIAVIMGLTAGYYFHSIHDAPHIESPKWKVQQALWQEGSLTVA